MKTKMHYLLVALEIIYCCNVHASWLLQTVDTQAYVTYPTSMRLDKNDHPCIAYLDSSNHKLMYAKSNGTTWSLQIVDSTRSVYGNCSLALDSNDNPHISYATAYNLIYASCTGNSWYIQTVDSSYNVGWESSIVLDNQNFAHISYTDSNNEDLKYAKWNGSGWNIATVDSIGKVGSNNSIGLANNNYPQIAYQDYQNYLDYDVKYARWNGTYWEIGYVDSIGNVGFGISMAIDHNNIPHISYMDNTNLDLKYDYWSGSMWEIQIVDSGEILDPTSIVLDSHGYPHISYREYKGSYTELKYAKWNGASWQTDTIDAVNSAGSNSSIAIDKNDLPHISYTTMITNGVSKLKYARWIKNAPVLSWSGESNYTIDGINPESGDTVKIFTYRIKYTDIAGEAPLAGYPKLHIKKNNIEISSSPFTMQYVSGNNLAGAIYTFSTLLPNSTSYSYYFEAYDISFASASSFISGTGPIVNQSLFEDVPTEIPGIVNSSLAWGDYDNDQDLDLAVMGATDSSYVTNIYQNINGNFIEKAANLSDTSDGSLAWGDCDNDGDLDLAFAGGTVSGIYGNNGGSFFLKNGFNSFFNCILAWVDYDNNGALDLVISGGVPNLGDMTELYRNNSDGTFSVVETTVNLKQQGGSLAWGDYDNDGDLDLVIAGESNTGPITKIYRNDNSIFVDIDMNLVAVNSCSLAWGDYDNDGDLDLAIAGYSDSGDISKIYRNDSGLFVDINANLTGVYNSSLVWGDYDNDGDLDLAISGNSRPAGITKLYRNDNGSFVDTCIGFIGVESGSLAWGDYDNDGDLDLALSGYTGSEYIFKLYKSLLSENGNPNSRPVAPISGFSSRYNFSTGIIEFRWDYGSDTETILKKGLYYDIRIATLPISDNLGAWIVSPSTGIGTTPFLGNYPHGFVNDSKQPGFNLKISTTSKGLIYYWQVRTIDTGFMSSAWSTMQVVSINSDAPGAIFNLTALTGKGSGEIDLQWSSSGSNGFTEELLFGSKYAIQYSTTQQVVWSTYSVNTVIISTNGVKPFDSQNYILRGLVDGSTYYVRIWTSDELANWSDMSNIVTAKTSSIDQAVSISGYIKNYNNVGISGIILFLSGSMTRSTI